MRCDFLKKSVYDGLTIAPVWGLQRTYENGINIALVTGAGYNFGTNQRTSGFVPVINFTLGWVLSKQGKNIGYKAFTWYRIGVCNRFFRRKSSDNCLKSLF